MRRRQAGIDPGALLGRDLSRQLVEKFVAESESWFAGIPSQSSLPVF